MKRYLVGLIIFAACVGIILILKPLLKIIYPIPHAAVILEYSVENELDPFLVTAVIRVESNFDEEARSPKGALGLMQVLPSTGEWVASKTGIENFGPQHLANPEINVRLGTWYLASLLEEFDGDMVLALAAYNGGGGNVTKWLETNEWSGEWLTVDGIPFEETRNFVKRVMGYFQWYSYAYGGEFPSELPTGHRP